jgi:hypothetical protein
MTDSLPPPLPPPPPKPPQRPLALPLVLAFVPAVLVLLAFSLNLPKGQLAMFCIPAAIVSLACCAFSSIMLFKRNTPMALVFGVLLAMMNVVISLGLGCASFLADANFH